MEHEAVSEVAAALGNTPDIARKSYIDPRVIRAWEQGHTISATLRRARRLPDEDKRRDATEKAVLRLLRAR
jgi:DNA topoisomerase IB